MGDPKKLRSDATCMAPVDYDDKTPVEKEKTCGKSATQERVVEGMTFPLCAAHAEALDKEEQAP